MDRHGAFHLLPALLLIFLLLGGLALRAGPGTWLASERVVPWLLASILFSGLALRLSGINHGLPDIIAHCDTPRHLDLISQFLSSDLIQPSSYPLGHIYLYTALLKLSLMLLPMHVAMPNLRPESIAQCAYIIVSVRMMQAILGAAILWLAFLLARRLWDPWTGLLWVMASLYGRARIFLGGGWSAYLGASLAVATKMYGGYVLGALLVAHVTGGRREHWRLLASAALAPPRLAGPPGLVDQLPHRDGDPIRRRQQLGHGR